MTLPYSGAIFVQAFPKECTETLMEEPPMTAGEIDADDVLPGHEDAIPPGTGQLVV